MLLAVTACATACQGGNIYNWVKWTSLYTRHRNLKTLEQSGEDFSMSSLVEIMKTHTYIAGIWSKESWNWSSRISSTGFQTIGRVYIFIYIYKHIHLYIDSLNVGQGCISLNYCELGKNFCRSSLSCVVFVEISALFCEQFTHVPCCRVYISKYGIRIVCVLGDSLTLHEIWTRPCW